MTTCAKTSTALTFETTRRAASHAQEQRCSSERGWLPSLLPLHSVHAPSVVMKAICCSPLLPLCHWGERGQSPKISAAPFYACLPASTPCPRLSAVTSASLDSLERGQTLLPAELWLSAAMLPDQRGVRMGHMHGGHWATRTGCTTRPYANLFLESPCEFCPVMRHSVLRQFILRCRKYLRIG